MRSDLAEMAPMLGDGAHELVRRPHAEETMRQAGVARKILQRDAHAAAPRVASKRREARRSRKPDPQTMLQAEVAQTADPGEQHLRTEAELCNEMDRDADRFRR